MAAAKAKDKAAMPGDVAPPLVAWYARAKRDLPWRRSRDPYGVWVSEIMLQQTQVDRVRKFFVHFMDRFPTVHDLAAAREADVLKHWEGLGYYRRARQLHAAAKQIVAEHAGSFPRTVDELESLPGIGRYTAGAIASIAFDVPAPIVEANSRRVIARLVGHAAPLDGPRGDAPIWKIAEQLVPKKHAGRFNQALMDLGAMVCTPERPLCTRCPLAARCSAHRTNRAGSIPAKAQRREPKRIRETAVVVRHGRSVLVERRGAGEWWEGLWDFPREAAATGRKLGTVAYTVTHHRITCVVRERVVTRRQRPSKTQRWVGIADLASLAMSSPGRKIVGLLKTS